MARGAEALTPAGGQRRRRLRILHLAFDDHRRPGSGGGAVRNREINRRLAQRHEVTAVTVSYPGSRERVEDGVRYIPAGLPLGYYGSILTYFAALPFVIWSHRSDLLVEDFAAPFGSWLVPLLTRRPVVAHVQWLSAVEKSKQYHLPFHLTERWGVRLHRVMVAVSEGVGERLRAMNRRAEVVVLPNGVDEYARRVPERRRRDVLYLGRLEMNGKGLDLMLDAFQRVARRTEARLLIAGDGPDAEALSLLARRLGIEDRIELLGRVAGTDRFDLLGSAQVVACPSRYESFGMVALEAMACATPVVAFDIPCQREILADDCSVTVPAFDVAAFAEALRALLADPERCREIGERARSRSRFFDWEEIAARQELVYAAAVGIEGEDDDRRVARSFSHS